MKKKKSPLEWHQRETCCKNNVTLLKKSDWGLQSSQKRNNSARLDSSPVCRTKKGEKKAFGLLFSLLCAAVLLLHKDGAQFLNIAWLALPCFAVSRVTLPSLAMAYLLSMPLSNCTNVSRIGRHSGCLVKNAPKHIRQMTKSVKTSHEQTLKSHGVKSTNGAALVDSEGHKCKQKKKSVWKILTNVITTRTN